MLNSGRIAVEVLELRPLEAGRRWLADAVVRVGPVEIRNIRVTEIDGRLVVRLPGTVASGVYLSAVYLEESVFLELRAAVLAEYRGARWSVGTDGPP